MALPTPLHQQIKHLTTPTSLHLNFTSPQLNSLSQSSMASPKPRTRRPVKPKPQFKDLSIPNHFRCPISLDLMKDPVTIATGITYDRQSIETWLDMPNFTCPVTNQELDNYDLIPNHSLRRMIQDWCVEHRTYGIERIPTPKIPITQLEASEILSEIPSLRNRDWVMKIAGIAKESEKNRRCFVGAGVARVLASFFVESSFLSEEILSTMVLFLPLDYEASRYLSTEKALKTMVGVLKSGEIAARVNAITVYREVISMNKNVIRIADETEGLIEGIVEMVRKPISPRATKTALMSAYYMISYNEKIVTKFVDLGFVPLVVEVLVDSDKGVTEKALAVFDAICGSKRGRDEAYGHALTVPVLVKKMFRVSDMATEFVVSALWKLCKKYRRDEDAGEEGRKGVLEEALLVGAFEKVLMLLQVGCSAGTKEKATELLKLMNGSRERFGCIDAMDFKGLKKSF